MDQSILDDKLSKSLSIISSLAKRYREKEGLSQPNMAEKIGLKRSTYAEFERGKSFIGLSNLVQLADLLKIPFSQFASYFDSTDNATDSENILDTISSAQRERLEHHSKDKESFAWGISFLTDALDLPKHQQLDLEQTMLKHLISFHNQRGNKDLAEKARQRFFKVSQEIALNHL